MSLKSQRILKWAKKIKAIEFLGGKCKKCGDENIFHLTFHHNNGDKNIEISKLNNSRWSAIEHELKKCELLCYNCHYETHHTIGKRVRSISNKKLFLEIKGNIGCESCGYNNHNCSLNFHHTGNKKYIFSRFNIEFKTIEDLTDEILIELSSCDVLCANCHQEIHTDIDFFEENKKYIIEKSKNIKENTPKLNRDIVKKMYFTDNLKQVEIAKFFGCSKGTISDIIKKLK